MCGSSSLFLDRAEGLRAGPVGLTAAGRAIPHNRHDQGHVAPSLLQENKVAFMRR